MAKVEKRRLKGAHEIRTQLRLQIPSQEGHNGAKSKIVLFSPNGSHGGLAGHGSSEHLATLKDDVLALPDHGADGSAGHVRDEAGEEALAGEISVVLLHVLAAGGGELHGDELVALLLEAGDNFSDEAALDAIGLDHDVCEYRCRNRYQKRNAA